MTQSGIQACTEKTPTAHAVYTAPHFAPIPFLQHVLFFFVFSFFPSLRVYECEFDKISRIRRQKLRSLKPGCGQLFNFFCEGVGADGGHRMWPLCFTLSPHTRSCCGAARRVTSCSCSRAAKRCELFPSGPGRTRVR